MLSYSIAVLYIATCLIHTYDANHPQLKWSTCVMRGVTHTRVCILDSTRMYMHAQYYTRLYVCTATVALADY